MVPVSKTWSPAWRVLASSLVRGSVIFLLSILKHLRFMTCYMAVDVNCTWHTCDMSRHSLNVQTDSCGLSAKALRSDTKLVDLLQHLFLKICIVRILSLIHI